MRTLGPVTSIRRKYTNSSYASKGCRVVKLGPRAVVLWGLVQQGSSWVNVPKTLNRARTLRQPPQDADGPTEPTHNTQKVNGNRMIQQGPGHFATGNFHTFQDVDTTSLNSSEQKRTDQAGSQDYLVYARGVSRLKGKIKSTHST